MTMRMYVVTLTGADASYTTAVPAETPEEARFDALAEVPAAERHTIQRVRVQQLDDDDLPVGEPITIRYAR